VERLCEACAQQTEKNHSTQTLQFHVKVYVHALLVQHLQSVFFQYMIGYVPKSEKVWMQRRQKNSLKYTDCAELKKITIRSYSKLFDLFSLFQVLQISLLFVLFDLKKVYS